MEGIRNKELIDYIEQNKVSCARIDGVFLIGIKDVDIIIDRVKNSVVLADVVAMLPSDDEIEQEAKEEADRLHQFGDDTEWYARSLGFIDGAEFVKNKLHGN